MDIGDAIKAAWTAVEESGVPEHVQELAFREALRSLLGTRQPTGPSEGNPSRSAAGGTVKARVEDSKSHSDSSVGEDDASADEEAVLGAVAEHTGVAIEKLEKVFHLDNGVVKLLVNHTALGKTAADKTRATAQIITIVRKVGMNSADTPFDIIRDECTRKHFYDSKNFASKHLPNIDGFAVKGEGKNRRLEARNGGISAFPALIDRVLGES